MAVKKIKTIFLDIGGVLLKHDQAAEKFQRKVALAVRCSLKELQGIQKEGIFRYWPDFEVGKISAFDFYWHYRQVLFQAISPESRLKLPRRFPYSFFAEALGNIFVPNRRMCHFQFYLKERAGAKLILVSNNDVIHYPYCLKAAPQIFQLHDGCILSHLVGVRKPDPAIWAIALEKADCRPEEALMIDDKKENIDSAEAFGLYGHVFSTVGDLKTRLKEFGFYFPKMTLP